MSNTKWQFRIYLCKSGEILHPKIESSYAILRDRQLFGSLYTLLNQFIRPEFSADWIHDISLDPSEPELQLALQLLNEAGLKPAFQAMLTPDQRGQFFPVRRERPAFSANSSNWLQLMCTKGNRGGQIISLEDDVLVARADKFESKRKGHCLDLSLREFAVTEEFKQAFNDAGLVGAVFRPIKYIPEAPGCKRLYWLDTNIVAPWSPWARRIERLDVMEDVIGLEIKGSNQPLIGHKGSVFFDDEGYVCPGMAYRKSDMVALEGVDFMRQAEWTVEFNGIWRTEHIVSQRFHNWATKFGCRFIMNGVKLID